MMGLELGHGSVGMGRREHNQRSKKVKCIKYENWIWVVKEREEERMTQAFGLSHWGGWWVGGGAVHQDGDYQNCFMDFSFGNVEF